MAHDVFVSYSTKDKVVADTIVSALEQNQIRCWYAPRDIQPSDDWGNAITQAIEESHVFLVIFSENANRSQRVLDEVNLAISQQDVILPFRIENLEPKGAMKLHLSSRHWLDAYEPSWESHIKQLVMTVSNNLEKHLEEADVKMGEAQEKKAISKKANRNVVIGIASTAVVAVLAWFGYAYATTGRLPAMIAGVEPTATSKPFPTATSKPLPTLTEVLPTETPDLVPTSMTLPSAEDELGEPDYATDFSNSAEDVEVWPIGKRDVDGNVYIETDGTLFVDKMEAMLYEGGKNYHDSIIEVDAKFLEHEGKNQYYSYIDLICRGNYHAVIHPDGEITISNGHQIPFTVFASGHIPVIQTNKYYRLRFDCVGDEFTVYVDGALILRGIDSSFYSGTLGLSTYRATAKFDNFKLWLP